MMRILESLTNLLPESRRHAAEQAADARAEAGRAIRKRYLDRRDEYYALDNLHSAIGVAADKACEAVPRSRVTGSRASIDAAHVLLEQLEEQLEEQRDAAYHAMHEAMSVVIAQNASANAKDTYR